ncbi:MAG: rRNA maturation RNase YbeY [Bauldia sp.]
MNAASGGLAIDLAVEEGDWPDEDVLFDIAAGAARAIAEETARSFAGQELSILFTDDARIAVLNADWRGKPKPTNVLSFPAPEGTALVPPGQPVPLGDIVLAHETVAKEAAEADLTLRDHITHLLVHGLLHLRGHDHEDDAAADAMERLEAAILARLGIADPYAGSEPERIKTAGRNGS